jgi:hypothetical protein
MLASSNEYAYFDSKMLSNWAGPNHWKFRQPTKGISYLWL